MYGDTGNTADVFSIAFILQHKIENQLLQEICLEQVRCSQTVVLYDSLQAGPFEVLTQESVRDILHTQPDRPQGPFWFLWNRHWVLSGSEPAERWRWPLHPSTADAALLNTLVAVAVRVSSNGYIQIERAVLFDSILKALKTYRNKRTKYFTLPLCSVWLKFLLFVFASCRIIT
jgi:hypothetical protein